MRMPPALDPREFLVRLAATRRAIEDKLAPTAAGRRTLRLLARLERRLARPLRVAVLGETNSGKTTLANAIIGHDLLAADVIPNTRAPVLVRHAARPAIMLVSPDGHRQPIEPGSVRALSLAPGGWIEVAVPLARLAANDGLEILDTPGHDVDEPSSVPAPASRTAVDIAIWCTIATQAWRATEVEAWQALQRPAVTSLLAVTRADLLAKGDRDKVLGRLTAEAGAQFAAIVMCEASGPIAATAISPPLEHLLVEVRQARCRKAALIVRRAADGLDEAGRHVAQLDLAAVGG